jgi:predicted nucleic acid-binding protein
LIVVDASAVVSALAGAPDIRAVAHRRFAGEQLHAPHLVDLEVVSRLRRGVFEGRLELAKALAVVRDLESFRIEKYPHRVLLLRIWQLRDNVSAYDASYVALAELLGAVLVTADGRLARAPGPRCAIELLA